MVGLFRCLDLSHHYNDSFRENVAVAFAPLSYNYRDIVWQNGVSGLHKFAHQTNNINVHILVTISS